MKGVTRHYQQAVDDEVLKVKKLFNHSVFSRCNISKVQPAGRRSFISIIVYLKCKYQLFKLSCNCPYNNPAIIKDNYLNAKVITLHRALETVKQIRKTILKTRTNTMFYLHLWQPKATEPHRCTLIIKSY